MPFQSRQQMKWMFANHPAMAKRWAKDTSNIKSLPERKYDRKMKKKMKIKVKKGALHKQLGIKEGTPIPIQLEEELKHSKNPKTRARAIFALNARQWNHRGRKKSNAMTSTERSVYRAMKGKKKK